MARSDFEQPRFDPSLFASTDIKCLKEIDKKVAAVFRKSIANDSTDWQWLVISNYELLRKYNRRKEIEDLKIFKMLSTLGFIHLNDIYLFSFVDYYIGHNISWNEFKSVCNLFGRFNSFFVAWEKVWIDVETEYRPDKYIFDGSYNEYIFEQEKLYSLEQHFLSGFAFNQRNICDSICKYLNKEIAWCDRVISEPEEWGEEFASEHLEDKIRYKTIMDILIRKNS